MSSTTHLASLAPVYRKALKTWRPVILFFGNEDCPACESAEPVFREVAQRYRHHANIYVLNTGKSPRHPNVTGTPTVLFFKDGRLLKKLKGIGTRQTLEQDFANHVGKLRPRNVRQKPSHDLAWLRQTLRRLCTVPRASERLGCRGGC
ncbi:thioredoxin family protein [Pseudomonas sp. GL-B-19]|uniref:thioredoxin family protein n=1 Tax=Pseudomonas sp. GL-B-19 TaxID=2832393 RepID=UPI001CBEFB6C|nr:thioredoxin family protein [Pseudomonas sp. GL-B-19]